MKEQPTIVGTLRNLFGIKVNKFERGLTPYFIPMDDSASIEAVNHEVIGEKKKVFLGGTCNESTWREELIEMLEIGYYDPVSASWTPTMKKEEIIQREDCTFVLYCITPKMTGVYSIAEAVDDSNKQPKKLVFCVLKKDGKDEFTDAQEMSLNSVAKLIVNNGGKYFRSLKSVADYLNGAKK